jgi:hypothetical protein
MLRACLAYSGTSVFCIVFDRVYALFGHGVLSDAMTLMFLYPLLGGVLPCLLLWLLSPGSGRVRGYRLGSNLYHAGLATLILRSALAGVFEIAGTASPYLVFYLGAGVLLMLAGLLTVLPGFLHPAAA